MRTSSPSRSLHRLRTRLLCALFAAVGGLATGPRLALAAPEPLAPTREAERGSTLQDIIAEASQRFGVPGSWITEVMAVESRGHADALSSKGAIGLMQVMPETYAGLRLRYGLGADPWNPRDNVLAGAAYLRELYDRYGAPGFLAAYNAGPGRWDDYRLRGRPLAPETIAYLARLGPVVGGGVLPLPTFAGAPVIRSPFVAPIFVAHSTDPARIQATVERAGIMRIVEANASVVGRAGAIFVTRTRTVELPPSHGLTGDRAAEPRPSERSRTDEATPPVQPSNPLFPPRSGVGSPR